MKLKLSKKIGIEIGALIIIGLIVVFMTNANTSLFKGAVGEGDAAACQAATSEYSQLHLATKTVLDEAEALNEENSTLEGYDEREALIAAINTFLTENPTYDCSVDMSTIVAQLTTYRDTDIANMKSSLDGTLESMPVCPLDDEQHADYAKFTTFLEAHADIEAGIASLNAKKSWDDSDYEKLENLVLAMRILDISDLSGIVTDEEEAEIRASLQDIDVVFANSAIGAYNTEVVGKVKDLDCEQADVIAFLNAPIECEEGTAYSESSQTCVAVAAAVPGTECEYDEMYLNMDLVYGLLELGEDDASEFGSDEEDLLQSLLDEFPSRYKSEFSSYITNFDYQDDANDLINDLNFTIAASQSEQCFKDTFSVLTLVASNASNNNDEEEYTCPVGASHDVVNDIDICTCDNDASIVEQNGTCENQGNNSNEEFSAEEIFLCLDGITETDDPFDCPGFGENIVDEGAEEYTPTENNYNEYYSSADNTQEETVEVNQGSNIDLTTNTNPNIMTSPEVQGDTGPGGFTAFLLFLSVLGGGLLRSLSLI